MRFALTVLLVTSVLLAQAEVHADATALVLVVDPALPRCPDEAALRELVSARLGRDPFVTQDGGVTAHVELRREGRHAMAVVQFVAADGTLLGTRRLGPASTRCTEIAEAIAATLAVAMEELAPRDPPRASEAAATTTEPTSTTVSPPTPAAAPAPPTVADVYAPETPAPPQEREPAPATPTAATAPLARLGVAGGVAIGWQPDVVGQIAFELGLDAREWSAILDVRMQSAAVLVADAGRADTSWVGAGLVGCGRIDWLSLCGVAVLGRITGAGSSVDVARQAWATTLGLGVSASLELRPVEWLGLSVRAEVVGAILRPNIVLDRQVTWDPPPVAAVFQVVAAVLTR